MKTGLQEGEPFDFASGRLSGRSIHGEGAASTEAGCKLSQDRYLNPFDTGNEIRLNLRDSCMPGTSRVGHEQIQESRPAVFLLHQ